MLNSSQKSFYKFNDKFGIIKNQINIDNIENLFYKHIEDIFEDKKSLILPSYIHQFVWFNYIGYNNSNESKINISYEKIKNIINNNLFENRNKLRINIKKNLVSINTLNIFIVNFIDRIKYIDILLCNNELINDSYKSLGSLIITDSIILKFLEELIIKFKNYIINDLKKFLSIINNINTDYYNKIINIVISILKNNYNLDGITSIKINQPSLSILYILDEKIKYYYKVNKYYNFIDFNNFIFDIINLIDENININSLSIKCLVVIFNNYFPIINNIINQINNNNIEYKNILIKILKKLINKINKNTFNDIFNIIIKYFYKILDINVCEFISIIINDSYINQYVDFIDEYIKNNYKNNCETPNLYYITLLVKYLNNKEKFYEYYNQKLLNRLLVMYDQNKNYYLLEEKIIERLEYKYLDKIINMIQDVKKSYINNNNNDNIKILVISYSWNLNFNNLQIKFKSSLLNSYIEEYERNYLHTNSLNNKIIKWLPHYGKVIITYLNIDILMLPIQFLILELFEENNSLNINEIYSFLSNSYYNQSDIFKNNIINSLINSNILIKQSNNLILNYKTNFKNNFIEIFIELSNNILYESNNYNKQFTINEIIEANINSILKIKELNFNILFDKINCILEKDHGKINEKLFIDTLAKMIDKDLIKKINDTYFKIYY